MRLEGVEEKGEVRERGREGGGCSLKGNRHPQEGSKEGSVGVEFAFLFIYFRNMYFLKHIQ